MRKTEPGKGQQHEKHAEEDQPKDSTDEQKPIPGAISSFRHGRPILSHATCRRQGMSAGFWRVGHLLLAWAAVIGLLAHGTTTLFFAEFAAGGREIYWWHIRK